MLFSNVIDEFHDDNGLANTGSPEQSDLAALQERLDEINDFNAGLKHFLGCRLFFKAGRGPMNWPALGCIHRTQFVHGLSDDVDHASYRRFSDGYRNGPA